MTFDSPIKPQCSELKNMAEEIPVTSNSRVFVADFALRLLAGFQLLLMVSTLPIWWHSGAFPAVPLLNPGLVPSSLLTGSSIVIAMACFRISLTGGLRRLTSPDHSRFVARWTRIAIIAGITAAVANQHCLQAWHTFFLWALSACSFLNPERRLGALRHLFACVYVCSGLSRISTTPAVSGTGLVLGQLFSWLPAAVQPSPPQFALICHAAAFCEIGLGLVLLSSGRMQRIGLFAACGLHASLLLALGPLGLGHQAGVLLWNISFLLLLPLVFRMPLPSLLNSAQVAAGNSRSSAERRNPLAAGAIWCLLLWLISLAGLVGVTDNWPSWQLYSSRPEQWQLWIDRRAVAHLDPPFAVSPVAATVDELIAVRIDQASLLFTGTPLYPEDRFQLAIIEAVLQRLPAETRFEVRIDEPARYLWWNRSMRTIDSREKLAEEHKRFLLNSYPVW
jgi:hypothetical protein